MKSALTVVLFRLFTIGVFVDGKEASNVLVMEGDSVTLKPGVTDLHKNDRIEWRFKGIRIDTFVDGLQRDSQTGDLKISNIRTEHSGLYKVKISSTNGSSEMEFNVEVESADEAKSVSVMEGYSVTLRTDLTEIQRDDVIRWFGQQKSLVAEINRAAEIFNTYDGPDGRFRDRLKLDHQTGSLIITDTRTTDAGLYKAEISSTRSKHTIHYTQSFNVTVSDSGVQSGSDLSPGAVAGIVVSVAVVLLLVAAVAVLLGFVIYYRRKNSDLERQMIENGVNRNTQKTDDHATEETKMTNDP